MDEKPRARAAAIGTKVALVLPPVFAAVSLVALVALLIGYLGGIKGAADAEQGVGPLAIAWTGFSLGTILALLTGVIALVLSRRREYRSARVVYVAVIAYCVVAAVLFSVVDTMVA